MTFERPGTVRLISLLQASSIALAITSVPMSASDAARQLAWENPVPPKPEIDNPFDQLTREQLDDLGMIARTRDLAAMGKSSAELEDRAEVSLWALQTQGLDIDALLAQREEIIASRVAAAQAVDETLDGTTIRMPGYVLPLSFDQV